MKESQKEALNDVWSLLTLIFFNFSGLMLGFMCIINYILPAIGIDVEENISGFSLLFVVLGALVTVVLLIYLSIFIWLIFAHFFLKRNSVWRVANLGPITKFDRWLLNKFIGIKTKQ